MIAEAPRGLSESSLVIEATKNVFRGIKRNIVAAGRFVSIFSLFVSVAATPEHTYASEPATISPPVYIPNDGIRVGVCMAGRPSPCNGPEFSGGQRPVRDMNDRSSRLMIVTPTVTANSNPYAAQPNLDLQRHYTNDFSAASRK